MNTTDILANDLSNFIEELRDAGYNIGTAQFIAVQRLILGLIEHNALPTEPDKLCILLGPVLCHSPKEQEEFKPYFYDWMSRFESRLEKSVAATEMIHTDAAPSETSQWRFGKEGKGGISLHFLNTSMSVPTVE